MSDDWKEIEDVAKPCGEIYTITDTTVKAPRRITLKETGPCYWALLEAFELVKE